MKLRDNEYTLFPYDEESANGLPRHDNGAYIVAFQGEIPPLTEDWVIGVEEVTGRAVWVRRADCGAGCRCAGEFTFTPPEEMNLNVSWTDLKESLQLILEAEMISPETSSNIINSLFDAIDNNS